MRIMDRTIGTIARTRKKIFQQGWGILNGTILMGGVYAARGIVSYGYMLVAVQLLGTDRYGLFSIIFSIYTMISFVFGQAVETMLSKYIAEAISNGQNYFPFIRRLFVWTIVVSIIIVGVSLALPEYMVQSIFPEAPSLFYFSIGVGIIGSYDMAVRGLLRGMQAIGLYGLSTVVQMILRLVFLLLFVWVIDWGLTGASYSLLVGLVLSILITIGFWLHLRSTKSIEYTSETELKKKDLVQYLLPTIIIFTLMSIYYSSTPLLIKVQNLPNANEMAGMFMLAVYISRITIQLTDALSVNLLPRLSRTDVQSNAKIVQGYILRSYQFLIPFGVITVVGLYVAGPWLLHIFHKDYQYSNLGMGLLGLNVAFLILMSVPSQVLLSRSKMFVMTLTWFLGCVIFIGILLWGPWAGLRSFEMGYVISGFFMFIILLWQAIALTRS